MGFTQNDEGFWIKKTDVTPQKRSHRGSDSDANSEDEEEEPITRTPSTATRTPNVTRTPREPHSTPSFPSLHMGSSSRIPPSSSHEPQLGSFEVSFGEIKEEQKKLGQQLENLAIDMKTGFDDIKKLFAAHDERFNLLDKDVRLLKHQVNNSINVASGVIQATVNDLKLSAQDVINATEVRLEEDRYLRPRS
ncbi:hypothetical protein CJ030_MR0G025471 [Morella rubra]|uniref:Uncharacterized protein n=1 Tax=Morella rubra TaxID=262757 RepID=A0A6A1UF60_9ROSI|nr:hypothetical protein CJ030_MR0G025463 [Morella rubra]KAB1199284.1 hypothetical protein CJ030_MR0G025471 [Morella rubra]